MAIGESHPGLRQEQALWPQLLDPRPHLAVLRVQLQAGVGAREPQGAGLQVCRGRSCQQAGGGGGLPGGAGVRGALVCGISGSRMEHEAEGGLWGEERVGSWRWGLRAQQ